MEKQSPALFIVPNGYQLMTDTGDMINHPADIAVESLRMSRLAIPPADLADCENVELRTIEDITACDKCGEAKQGTNCVGLLNGEALNVLNPDPAAITLEMIAFSQAKMCRFNGQCSVPYSVTEHQLMCASVAELEGLDIETVKACLFHDTAEALTGDFTRPIKNLVQDILKPIENNLLKIIFKKFEIGPNIDWAAVKRIDNSVLRCEAEALMEGSDQWDWQGVVSCADKVPCRPGRHWRDVAAEFVTAAARYGIRTT